MTTGKIMRISKAGLDHIKSYESLRLTAYLPTKHDVLTIGWGHTRGVTLGMTITKAQAEEFLLKDLAWVEECVNKLVKVEMTQSQYDGLCGFVFNLGEANFAKSTMLKYINASKWKEAATSMLQWNKQRTDKGLVVLDGLTKRRAKEAKMLLA